MFRHEGSRRTYIHNLRLASILSFVAGIVNITGVLSVKILTTNVTGHFAFFSEDVMNKNYSIAIGYLFFIISFLLGAFVSNTIIEIVTRIKPRFSYSFPIAIEISILCIVGFFGKSTLLYNSNIQIIACSLLFAMGLQNALVTKVSQSVVRTTHLTGLFTDLGIELSQLFFYKKASELKELSKGIYLKLAIIGCFFFGCVVGGFMFRVIDLKTLAVASVFLVIALFYDNFRFHYYNIKRRILAR